MQTIQTKRSNNYHFATNVRHIYVRLHLLLFADYVGGCEPLTHKRRTARTHMHSRHDREFVLSFIIAWFTYQHRSLVCGTASCWFMIAVCRESKPKMTSISHVCDWRLTSFISRCWTAKTWNDFILLFFASIHLASILWFITFLSSYYSLLHTNNNNIAGIRMPHFRIRSCASPFRKFNDSFRSWHFLWMKHPTQSI